jgi:hypothetical protein
MASLTGEQLASEVTPPPSLLCEWICDRNAAKLPIRLETRRVGLGARLIVTCRFETREAGTGWLITQRSQVRILSPLPAEMALGESSGGHFHARWERFGNISLGHLTIVFVSSIPPVADQECGRLLRGASVIVSEDMWICCSKNAASACPIRSPTTFGLMPARTGAHSIQTRVEPFHVVVVGVVASASRSAKARTACTTVAKSRGSVAPSCPSPAR